MTATPADLQYSREHEWVRTQTDGTAVIGITAFAQAQLGDIVFLSLPEVGTTVEQFAKMGEVESVKAVSDLFSPLSGEILETNSEAVGHPERVNEDPYGTGWLLRLRPAATNAIEGLLTARQYDEHVAAQEPSAEL